MFVEFDNIFNEKELIKTLIEYYIVFSEHVKKVKIQPELIKGLAETSRPIFFGLIFYANFDAFKGQVCSIIIRDSIITIRDKFLIGPMVFRIVENIIPDFIVYDGKLALIHLLTIFE